MDRKVFWGLFGVWLAVMAIFMTAQSRVDPGGNGMPLDDAWIHLSFAKNIAAFGNFGINSGELSNGSTSPLWTILLSLGCWLGFMPGLFARLLGGFFVFLTSVTVYRLAYLLLSDKRVAFLTALFSLLCGRFIWGGLSGMEIPLFSFLAALALYHHELSRQQGRVALLTFCFFGLASLARPEGHFLFTLAVIDVLFSRRAFLRENGFRILGGVGLYIFMSLPYVIFSWLLTGRPLCGSYYSKMAFSWVYRPWDYLHAYFRAVFFDNPVLCAGAVYGLRFLWSRGQRFIPLWLTLLPLSLAFTAPLMFHHARYNIPLVPFYIMAGAAGLTIIPWRLVRRCAVVIALVWSLSFISPWALRYARDILSINAQHVRVALWLKDHALPGENVAANDVGAISFLSGRRVVDLCGIMDNKILKIMRYGGKDERRRQMLRRYLKARGVKYVAIYPRWFEWIVDDPALEKVFEAHVENNTAAGCDTMEVYRIR